MAPCRPPRLARTWLVLIGALLVMAACLAGCGGAAAAPGPPRPVSAHAALGTRATARPKPRACGRAAIAVHPGMRYDTGRIEYPPPPDMPRRRWVVRLPLYPGALRTPHQVAGTDIAWTAPGLYNETGVASYSVPATPGEASAWYGRAMARCGYGPGSSLPDAGGSVSTYFGAPEAWWMGGGRDGAVTAMLEFTRYAARNTTLAYEVAVPSLAVRPASSYVRGPVRQIRLACRDSSMVEPVFHVTIRGTTRPRLLKGLVASVNDTRVMDFNTLEAPFWPANGHASCMVQYLEPRGREQVAVWGGVQTFIDAPGPVRTGRGLLRLAEHILVAGSGPLDVDVPELAEQIVARACGPAFPGGGYRPRPGCRETRVTTWSYLWGMQ